MTYNETRIKQPVGTCPACAGVLEVVMVVTVVPGAVHTDIEISTTKQVVEMTGKVIGAVTIEHNCIPTTTRGGH